MTDKVMYQYNDEPKNVCVRYWTPSNIVFSFLTQKWSEKLALILIHLLT